MYKSTKHFFLQQLGNSFQCIYGSRIFLQGTYNTWPTYTLHVAYFLLLRTSPYLFSPVTCLLPSLSSGSLFSSAFKHAVLSSMPKGTFFWTPRSLQGQVFSRPPFMLSASATSLWHYILRLLLSFLHWNYFCKVLWWSTQGSENNSLSDDFSVLLNSWSFPSPYNMFLHQAFLVPRNFSSGHSHSPLQLLPK